MGKYAGGHVLTGVASCIHQVIAPKYVFITQDKINRVLGTDLDSSAIERIFDRLAYSYEKKTTAIESNFLIAAWIWKKTIRISSKMWPA